MSDFECIELDDVNDVSVVKFMDEKVVDPARIEKMGTELLSLAGDDPRSKLLLNFENVRFFSSAAINKLIVLEKRVRAQGGKLRLSNLRPEVKDLFSFTSLDSLFRIVDEQKRCLRFVRVGMKLGFGTIATSIPEHSMTVIWNFKQPIDSDVDVASSLVRDCCWAVARTRLE